MVVYNGEWYLSIPWDRENKYSYERKLQLTKYFPHNSFSLSYATEILVLTIVAANL